MNPIDDFEPPCFDEARLVEFEDGETTTLVIHRNPQLEIVAIHTPLTEHHLTCSICADGVRVYLD